MKKKISVLLLIVTSFVFCCGFVQGPSLNNLHEWIVVDIWNDGLCDFDWYMQVGTDACGNSSYDSDFALSKFKTNALQIADYDLCIASLPDTPENLTLKQDWEYLKNEIVLQYTLLSQYEEELPIDGIGLELGRYEQYSDAVENDLRALGY